MKLILKNHTEEYAAREIISAHIPKIKIELSDSIPETGDYVVSEVIYKNNAYTYNTTLSYMENLYTYFIDLFHCKILANIPI